MIGAMRERVTLQQESRVVDDGGGYPNSWVAVDTVWASVKPLTGRERQLAAQTEAPVSYRVTIRYRDDVTPAMRLVWGTRYLNITGIFNADQKKAYLTLECSEGVAT